MFGHVSISLLLFKTFSLKKMLSRYIIDIFAYKMKVFPPLLSLLPIPLYFLSYLSLPSLFYLYLIPLTAFYLLSLIHILYIYICIFQSLLFSMFLSNMLLIWIISEICQLNVQYRGTGFDPSYTSGKSLALTIEPPRLLRN